MPSRQRLAKGKIAVWDRFASIKRGRDLPTLVG
jgi:hypothetical protein